jgi:uncharacterized protein (TIGR04255 family)
MVPRLWFVREDDSELIQFQSNRFLYNWRRYGQSAIYPRYENVRERFFIELEALNTFIKNNKIGSIETNQCEISYVNHIHVMNAVQHRIHLDDILRCFRAGDIGAKLSSGHNIDFEDIRLSMRSVVSDNSNREPVGRLHIEAEPAVEPDGTPIIRLALTVRGNPLAPSLQGAADFFDMGREAIVRSFTSITTQQMHDMWGRRQ